MVMLVIGTSFAVTRHSHAGTSPGYECPDKQSRSVAVLRRPNARPSPTGIGCLLLLLSLLIPLLPLPAAAVTNTSCSVNAGGLRATNASLECTVTIGQGAPVGHILAPHSYSYVGFHNTFLWHDNLDNDTDGRCDEEDPDDDNDGLNDFDELAGTSFSPKMRTDPFAADSDGDGLSDHDESVTGTNPRDANSLLAITRIAGSNDTVTIVWSSREGKEYDVMSADTVTEIADSPLILDTLTATNPGSGEWQQTESDYTHTGGAARAFYGIRMSQH